MWFTLSMSLFLLQVRAASVGDPRDPEYDDWHGVPDLSEFMASAEGEEPFTVDSYCEEALMDRRGSLQISRWVREKVVELNECDLKFALCFLHAGVYVP